MGGEVRNSVHEPPSVLSNPFQIRCIVVASLQIFLQAQVVLPLAIGHVFGDREKLIDELLHLAVRQLDGKLVIVFDFFSNQNENINQYRSNFLDDFGPKIHCVFPFCAAAL